MAAIARPVVFADLFAKTKARSAILVVSFAVLTALLGQVKIGLGFTPVPITGQTIGALLAGAVLGTRMGALSQALYVLSGLVFPVYAGSEKGWHHLSGATGGYLIGMVVAAALVGMLAQRAQDRSFITSVPAMLFGSAVIYAIGVPYLAAVDHISVQRAVDLGVTPFVIGDTIKAILAGALLPIVWHYATKETS